MNAVIDYIYALDKDKVRTFEYYTKYRVYLQIVFVLAINIDSPRLDVHRRYFDLIVFAQYKEFDRS